MILFLCAGCAQKKLMPVSLEFQTDLASENNRLAGQLYRKAFNGNLETLTYEQYLEYFREYAAPSARGVYDIINHADGHLFKSKQYAFLIALYYEDSRMIICDNSGTSFPDWIKVFAAGEAVPTLTEFIEDKNF